MGACARSLAFCFFIVFGVYSPFGLGLSILQYPFRSVGFRITQVLGNFGQDYFRVGSDQIEKIHIHTPPYPFFLRVISGTGSGRVGFTLF